MSSDFHSQWAYHERLYKKTNVNTLIIVIKLAEQQMMSFPISGNDDPKLNAWIASQSYPHKCGAA